MDLAISLASALSIVLTYALTIALPIVLRSRSPALLYASLRAFYPNPEAVSAMIDAAWQGRSA